MSRRPWSLTFLLLAACNFDPSTPKSNASDADPDAPDADPSAADADPGAADADPGAADAGSCTPWSKQPNFFTPCQDVQEESADLTLQDSGQYIYNTDTHILIAPSQVETMPPFAEIGGATAILSGRFRINSSSTLRAVGTRPLLIISWSDMTIEGDIDVSSFPDSNTPDDPDTDHRGAGANSAICPTLSPGTSEDEGGGGGGGGGFGSAGGNGGEGHVDQNNNAGATGGSAVPLPLTNLRGGCPGSAGGQGNGLGIGMGAPGGGAIYLAARTTINVNATILAGGQGGHRATGGRSAGGGAGSGGLIGLDAPTVNVLSSAILAANGGGGGGGGNMDPNDSKSGENGQPSESIAAAGGAGETGGPADPPGFGGDGGYLGDDTDFTKLGFSGGRGGGGGGGGVGVILFSANTTPMQDGQSQVSPLPNIDIAPPR